MSWSFLFGVGSRFDGGVLAALFGGGWRVGLLLSARGVDWIRRVDIGESWRRLGFSGIFPRDIAIGGFFADRKTCEPL